MIPDLPSSSIMQLQTVGQSHVLSLHRVFYTRSGRTSDSQTASYQTSSFDYLVYVVVSSMYVFSYLFSKGDVVLARI